MNPILSVSNLEYRRGDRFALAVNRQDFFPGRIYCLAGPNGAGKSTFLNLLALLCSPDRGELRFSGEPVDSPQQRRRLRQQITLVEQSPFLFDGSVYQNLAFGLRMREVRGDLQRQRILRALDTVGLSGFESRRARALSGGEAQRVALARAMVLRPAVLLLDEPTDGLDRRSLPLFERCLSALAEEGTAVIIASHDADQPRRLGAEMLWIEAGQLAETPAPLPAAMNYSLENFALESVQ